MLYHPYVSFPEEKLENIKVVGGMSESVGLYSTEFGDVVSKGESSKIEKEIDIPAKISAPVKKGDIVGKVYYKIGDEKIGESEIYASEDVMRVDFLYQLTKIFENFLLY